MKCLERGKALQKAMQNLTRLLDHSLQINYEICPFPVRLRATYSKTPTVLLVLSACLSVLLLLCICLCVYVSLSLLPILKIIHTYAYKHTPIHINGYNSPDYTLMLVFNLPYFCTV